MKRFNVAVARKSMEQNRTEKAHFTETDVLQQNYNFNLVGQNNERMGPIYNIENNNLQLKKKSLSNKRSLVNQRNDLSWTQIP